MLFEFRQAVRTLKGNPSFSALCISTLALGIGTATAVFTVVNGVLLEPLRFPNPDRIVTLSTQQTGRANLTGRLSGGDFVDVRSTNRVFDAISVYYGGEMGVQVRGHAEFTGVWFVNHDFFTVFGQSRTTGAAVSAAFASRHFDERQAMGKQVQVENRLYTITEVIAGPRYPETAEVWLPAPEMPENLDRTAYNYRVVARLKSGVSVSQAQANLSTIARQIAPDSKTFVVVPLLDQLTGPIRQTLYLLTGAVFLVLLIACANVSNLLLARATVRTREMSVRAALGATRSRIVTQLLLESSVLAVLSAAAGVLLAWAGAKALLHFAPANLPRADEIHLSLPVLAFALVLSLLSALFFGAAPAWRASGEGLGGRGVLKGGSHQLRNSLVVAEIALSFVLATSAGLFFRSLLVLNSTQMGFQPERILVMYAHAPAKSLSDHVNVGQGVVEKLLSQLAGLPGVEASGAAMGLPTGTYGSNGYYAVAGRQVFDSSQRLPEANFTLASPQYFSALRVPLLQGREFTSRDRYDSPGVVIISQSLARQTFGPENPLGHQIVCGLDEASMKPMTIVGVAGDVRQASPASSLAPTLYMALEQHPFYANEIQVIVRTGGPPGVLTDAVRSIAHQFNPEMALKFTTLDTMVSESVSTPRFRTFVATTFSVLALLLAMAGIYGVISFMVSQRRAELGLRMALGALSSDIAGLVLRRAGLLALAGLVAGLALSVAASRLIGSFLFGLTATDLSTYMVVFAGVLAIVVLAAAVPAWRAARIQPLESLRQE